MLATALKIQQLYYEDECIPFIVYGGPLGTGKSAYALKVLYEVLSDWEIVKKFVVFPPEDFVDLCYRMMEQGRREKTVLWDDAGLHLSYMRWNDPFVEAVIEYLNVARTNWASLIFTTPQPDMIVKKLRGFPDRITIKIAKAKENRGHPNKPRIATAYRNWTAPDLKHSGVHKLWEDEYSAILPGDPYRPDTFYGWYKPLRDTYAAYAIDKMQKRLNELRKESKEQAKELNNLTKTILEEVKA